MIRVTINHSTVREKPSNDNKTQAEIIQGFVVDAGTVQELAEDVVRPNSKTWCPAVFSQDGVRANKYWASQQVFALDFDNGITPDKVLMRCKEYRIFPAFMYSSFSDTKEARKFRVVFVLPVEIANAQVRDIIQLALMEIFPECDQKCDERARMFYGGRQLVYTNYEAQLDIVQLIDTVCVRFYEQDTGNAARNIRRWCQNVGLNLINGLPAIWRGDIEECKMEEYNPIAIVYSIGDVEYSSPITLISLSTAKKDTKTDKPKYSKIQDFKIEKDIVRNPDWMSLEQQDPVFRDFIQGRDMHHDVTWMLAKNLVHIEGGIKKFWESLHKRETYDDIKWKSQLTYISKRSQGPVGYWFVEEYYPGITSYMEVKNLVQLARKEKRVIQQINSINREDVDMVYKRTEEYILQSLDAPFGSITCIRADTGVGKSRALVQNIESPCIIAVPLHELKDQLAEDFRNAGKDVMVTPELPTLDTYQQEVIDYFYSTGANKFVNARLKEIAENNPAVDEYLKKLSAIPTYNGILITTHARLPYISSPIQTVIVDEDFLPYLYQADRVPYKDLLHLEKVLMRSTGFGGTGPKKATPESRYIAQLIKLVETALDGQLVYMPSFDFTGLAEIEKKAIQIKGLSGNVLGFLTCVCFVKKEEEILFILKRELPRDKRYIVLSATVNEKLYRYAFDEVTYLDTGHAELKGELIQYPRYSYSRTTFNEHLNPGQKEHRLNYVKQYIPEDAVIITFKAWEREFSERETAHYHALVGLNKYAGKDIAVIGTPHLSPTAYLLLAGALGIRLNMRDFNQEFEERTVTRNGFIFHFRTYPLDSLLHEIQMFYIESELVQAIGRARLTRHDVKVFVFSNYPIPGARLIAA